MPIYMDRHNMPEGMSHEDVAHAHHADKEKQEEFDVNFLTYWFDQKAGCVFCLVDAPDKESVNNVHGASHGDIPVDIIPVDLTDVETFLGRISAPEKNADGHVHIDSPLRAILFTDLKDSTVMTQTLGDIEAIALFGEHDQIIRNCFPAHNGREVKHTGDGFMVAFDNVADSVHCAITIQKAFVSYNETARHEMHVRIGINAGQPIERGGDFFGITVNLASRTCDYAEADTILVTGVVHKLLSAHPDLQNSMSPPEKAYFKGFAHAVQIYKVKY